MPIRCPDSLPPLEDFVSEPRGHMPASERKNASEPRISVVMPSYNQGLFIRRSILSILNQDYANLELIIVDGGSTDETLDILQEFDPYIDYWTSRPDRGQSDALNKGFARATGDIFAWQNADDLYCPGAFSAVKEAFHRNPSAGIVFGDWVLVNEADQPIELNYALPVRWPRFSYENMKVYNQAIFWRREIHLRFGLFDEKLRRLMDNDMIIRMIRNEGIAGFMRLPIFLGAFRRQGQQKTNLDSMDEIRIEEESYLETKHRFAPRSSLRGGYSRISFRVFQFYHMFRRGGLLYALNKTRSGLNYRKGLL